MTDNARGSRRVVAFDLFGTVFDMSGVPREELQQYGDLIKSSFWRYWDWPKSWETLPLLDDDTATALNIIKDEEFLCVALSNAPMPFVLELCRNSGIAFDAIIPLETIHKYKPHLECYRFAKNLLKVKGDDFLMISANKNFGDIENSRIAGCRSQLIRHDYEFRTLMELAGKLRSGWWPTTSLLS